jgi:hypothetical protein
MGSGGLTMPCSSGRRARLELLAAAIALGLAACGGDGYGDGNNGGSTCTDATTVAIGDGGATPACARVLTGATVTLVNDRASTIEVRSGPHPTHGSCPELDATSDIPASGGAIQVVMTTLGACSFHDHLTGQQLGVIQVGSGSPGDPYNPM